MMRSLFSAVSGLRTHQTRMDVIGNNIANVNTPGYKSSRATFQEVFSQTLQGAGSPSGTSTTERGGTNPMQVGLGVDVASIDTIQTPGNLQPTGRSTDVAIEGNGFFVVLDGETKAYSKKCSLRDYKNLNSFKRSKIRPVTIKHECLIVTGLLLQIVCI